MHTRLFRTKTVVAWVLVWFAATVVSAAGPTWTDGQVALVVLGQASFSSSTTGTTATMMNMAQGVAVDPRTGKLFVADSENNRVLRFSSVAARASASSAEAVLGQADFTSGDINRGLVNPAQNTMYNPYSLFVDSEGRLWVSDYLNNRILKFDNASFKSNGDNADGVLGQEGFGHRGANRGGAVGANTLYFPAGLFVDSAGRLWVADELNHRVLWFDNAAFKANGADADGVLGQADFFYDGPATTRSGMYEPSGVVVSDAGTLFVAEYYNHRVLRFDDAASKADGADADGVLGQVDFTHNVTATTESGLNFPAEVTLDNEGRLYVSDGNNHRVVIFNNAAGKANGANADHVLGQADFTSGEANRGLLDPAQDTIKHPRQVFFDKAANVLWLADRGNNRVLRYGEINFSAELPLIVR